MSDSVMPAGSSVGSYGMATFRFFLNVMWGRNRKPRLEPAVTLVMPSSSGAMSQTADAVTLVGPPTEPASMSTVEAASAIVTDWSGTAVTSVVAVVVPSQVVGAGSAPLVRLAAT